MTKVLRALTAPHGQIASRHVAAAARTIYAMEFLGYGSITRFYDHLRIDHKLREACGLDDGWIVNSRVIAAVYSELFMLGALDVIDAQAKADPEIAKFRRRGRVAHRSHLSQNDHTKRPGTCEFCRGEFSGRGIARHLRSCGERAEAVRVADEELAVSLARMLQKDDGLSRLLLTAQTHRICRRERRALKRRWRRECRRSVPSPSAVFRYLSKFHDASEEIRRKPHTGFIPAPNEALGGLAKVNADMVGFVGEHTAHTQATLDMDATLIETNKQQALYCYQKYKAYQPLTTYWAEADQIVHSEFRDGNVPAGHEQLRVFRESLEYLPARVERVLLRSDTAGYQKELLRYCAEGRDERFGVIEFAVGVKVTPEFKSEVGEVADDEWRPLRRMVGERLLNTGQEYAEVCFVPNWAGHSKNNPDYRYLAIREPLRNPPLPGMEAQLELSVPTVQMSDGGWYKVTGVVTNRDIGAEELIWWYRQRCGKGEEVHSVVKEDLAGGRLPSGKFGANAAWWAMVVLAFNLNSALKQLALGKEWVSKRLKAIRFGVINVAGRITRHARQLTINLSRGHPSYELLVRARRRTLALAHGPPRT